MITKSSLLLEKIFLLQSQAVSYAAYWAAMTQPKSNREANYAFRMVIMRAQKPVQLTAAGFIPLSMETFGIVNIN